MDRYEPEQSGLFDEKQEDRKDERKISKYDKTIIDRALAENEPLIYYILCNKYKVKPEDYLFYMKGNAESMIRSKSDLQDIVNNPENYFSIKRDIQKSENLIKSGKPRKQRARYVPEVRYNNFLKEADSFYNTELSDYAEEKKRLLIKYFPSRFGEKGKQPIRGYDAAKVGSVFNKVFGSYNNR